MKTLNKAILKLSCSDRPGIVADVANFFRDSGFNIQESSQFNDVETKQFFMRCVFEWCGKDKDFSVDQVAASFSKIADKSDMLWQLKDSSYRPKVLIAVSKWGHCLNSLLNSWKLGSLPIDIVGVVSNHEDMRPLVEWYNLPYHYFPVSKSDKKEQEKKIHDVFLETQSDLLVLARYMQILSDDFCAKVSGQAINIHHSFLPGFKGAKPYHQAHARGVKLIGATAHYVTADLDEGPIIEQAVERVTHANTADQLVEIGRDIEAVVLQRAVRWQAEHRILINGHKTVVFNR
ncbi:MAG: formyltetrahydrofolate deformylase [Cellvibrionaceae bacterium]